MCMRTTDHGMYTVKLLNTVYIGQNFSERKFRHSNFYLLNIATYYHYLNTFMLLHDYDTVV